MGTIWKFLMWFDDFCWVILKTKKFLRFKKIKAICLTSNWMKLEFINDFMTLIGLVYKDVKNAFKEDQVKVKDEILD